MIMLFKLCALLSGIVVECQTDRSQIKNRKIALQKLRAIIYQRQLEHQRSLTRSARKQQVNFFFNFYIIFENYLRRIYFVWLYYVNLFPFN